MEEVKVLLYSAPINNAVVKFPARRYPGMLVQGDTFGGLLANSETIHKLALETGHAALIDETEGLRDHLKEMYDWYLFHIKDLEF